MLKNILKKLLPHKYYHHFNSRESFFRGMSIFRYIMKKTLLERWRKIFEAHRVRKYLIETNYCRDNSLPRVLYSVDSLNAMENMILSKLRFLQYEIPYADMRFLIERSDEQGFSSSILWRLSRTLQHSYMYNRTCLFDYTLSPYEFCFEPISSLSLDEIKETGKRCRFNFLPQNNRIVHSDNHIYHLLNVENNIVNQSYFDGLVMDTFLVLKEEYRSHIEKRRRAIGLKGPVIGIHIRQGDTNTDRGLVFRRFTLSDYIETLERVVSKTGVKTVFVATDSATVLKQLPRDSGISFIYDEEEKRYDNVNYTMLLKYPELRKQETMTSVKNIYLLGSCDYLVGSSSTLFTAALSIVYFRNKGHNSVLLFRQKEYMKWTKNVNYKSEKLQTKVKSTEDEIYITYMMDKDGGFIK